MPLQPVCVSRRINDEEKRQWVNQWWNEARFHLALAIKSPTELNKMLGNSLSEETMQLYQQARKKGMPFFITPYYLSLLNPTGKGYDDAAIRSYILYSPQLINTYGKIHAMGKRGCGGSRQTKCRRMAGARRT